MRAQSLLVSLTKVSPLGQEIKLSENPNTDQPVVALSRLAGVRVTTDHNGPSWPGPNRNTNLNQIRMRKKDDHQQTLNPVFADNSRHPGNFPHPRSVFANNP